LDGAFQALHPQVLILPHVNVRLQDAKEPDWGAIALEDEPKFGYMQPDFVYAAHLGSYDANSG
jgi:hypothetical protein